MSPIQMEIGNPVTQPFDSMQIETRIPSSDQSLNRTRFSTLESRNVPIMLIRNFRIAAKGKGEYCPVKNQLQIRKGRMTYRFTCEETELWFSSSDHANVRVLISPDASVRELRRSISSIVDSYEFKRGRPPIRY